MTAVLQTAAATLLLASLNSATAHAEYDSQGRYVPSPMGRPSDPYRSYVPGYTGKPAEPGKPGEPKRFAPTPRAMQVPLPKIAPFDARQPRPATAEPLPLVQPTPAQCKAGWSRATAISRSRFTRACRAMGVKVQR